MTVNNPDSLISMTQVTVPAGAASGNIALTIGIAENLPPFPFGAVPAGKAVFLGPSGYVFSSPITVKLIYQDADGDGFVDGTQISESQLGVFTLNETTGLWEQLPILGRDIDANVIIFQCNHFSIYALLTSPGQTCGAGSDDFSTLDESKWLRPEYSQGRTTYDKNNVRLGTDGLRQVMFLDAKIPASGGWTGAILQSQKSDFHYGTYRATFKAAKGTGVYTGFFTFHKDVIPGDVDNNHEIDVEIINDPHEVNFNVWTRYEEGVGKKNYNKRVNFKDGLIYSSDSGQAETRSLLESGIKTKFADFDAWDNFYTYEFEWQHDRVDFYIYDKDNNRVHICDISSETPIPSIPGNIMLNAWVPGGTWAGDPSVGTHSAEFDSVYVSSETCPPSLTGFVQHYYPDTYYLVLSVWKPISSVTVFGPHCQSNSYSQNNVLVTLSDRPSVGDVYNIHVRFTDSSTDTFTFTVLGINDGFAAITSPAPNSSLSIAPTFSWQAVSGITAYNVVVLEPSEPNPIWQSGPLSVSTTSCVYNFNGTGSPLEPGKTYTVNVETFDANGNMAARGVEFTVASNIEKIIFSKKEPSGNYDLWMINPDRSGEERLTDEAKNGMSSIVPTLFPDGKRILYQRGYNIAVFDLRTRQVIPLTTDGANGTYAYYGPHLSPDGTKIAYSYGLAVSGSCSACRTYEIYMMDVDSNNIPSNVTRMTNNIYRDGEAQFSPDGTKLLVTHYQNPPNGDCCNQTNIYIMDIATKTEQLLYGTSQYDWGYDWTNEGILFTANSSVLARINPDRSGYSTILDASKKPQSAIFSPSGDKILFCSTMSGSYNLYTANPDGSMIEPLVTDSNVSHQASWGVIK